MAKREKDLISFRLDSQKRDALDTLASLMNRDRSYVLNEAIEAYLDLHEWQLKEIKKGLQEAEAGKFASEDAVNAFFEKWSDAH